MPSMWLVGFVPDPGNQRYTKHRTENLQEKSGWSRTSVGEEGTSTAEYAEAVHDFQGMVDTNSFECHKEYFYEYIFKELVGGEKCRRSN